MTARNTYRHYRGDKVMDIISTCDLCLSLSLSLHKSLFACVLLPEFQRTKFFLGGSNDTWCDEEGEIFSNKLSILPVNLIQSDMEPSKKSLR